MSLPGTRWLPLLLLGSACTLRIPLWQVDKDTQPQASSAPGIANPASVFCEQHNGRLVIRKTTQGDTGYCVFQDLSYCEEWAFYRGQCKPGDQPNFQ